MIDIHNNTIDYMKYKFIGDIHKLTGVMTLATRKKNSILLNLGRELHFKYSDFSDGRYHFFFSENLLKELSRTESSKFEDHEFCIVLFCGSAENACILKFKELFEFYPESGDLSLSIKQVNRSFYLSSANHKKRVSKKSILPKILGK